MKTFTFDFYLGEMKLNGTSLGIEADTEELARTEALAMARRTFRRRLLSLWGRRHTLEARLVTPATEVA